MTSVERTTSINAGAPDAWAVLADFGALADWVPMIGHSCLLSEQTGGVGTVRRVQIARQTLVERVTTWEPAQRLSYAIEGLPPIVGPVRNSWAITPTDDGCDVTLTTEIDAGNNPVKRLVARKVLDRLATASELMLAGLASATSGERR